MMDNIEFFDYYTKVNTPTGFFVVRPGEVISWDKSTIKISQEGRLVKTYTKEEFLDKIGPATEEPVITCKPCQSKWKPSK